MEEDKTNKVEIHIHDGGQGNFAFDNGKISATQTNLTGINNHKQSDKCNIVVDKKFQNNKKQEYIDNWNSRLFLHQDNEERPLTLADVFIMPCFHCNKKITQIEFSDEETLEQVIENFITYNRTSNMLIKGVPGIGKTSLISWIANKYRDDDRIIILRFRDWEKEELEKGLLKAIYNILECKKVDLNDKILILDGFDEIKNLNAREQLLHKFFNEILDIRNIKIMITSRLGYLNSIRFQNEFELLPFKNDYIEKFYQKITSKEIDKGKISDENLDVLGIPVILYMAIMSKIDITKKATKPELYNRIFAEEGGIFDRFSYKGIAYDEGSHLLRDKENIRKYLKFLRKIAFIMFEKSDLSLLKKECKIPELEFQGDLVSILEFPIKHLFESTESNIEFVHKSISEYFISEYIFMSINERINKNVSKEEFAGVLGSLFRANILSEEILEFLKYRVRSSDELKEKFNIVKDTFQLMLQDGTTYYTSEKYKNVIKCEMNVFANMLEVIHLWEVKNVLNLSSKMYEFLKCGSIGFSLNLILINLGDAYLEGAYLRRAKLRGADLIGADLREANLREANLREAYLKGANLKGANLKGANLREANLREANLREAKLIEAYLIGADLKGANLKGADLKGADLREAKLRGAYLRGAYLRGAYLRGADLREAKLRGADLREANLREAKLRGADLKGADLREANLREAYLIGADLTETNLIGATLDENQINYLENKYDFQQTIVYIEKTDEFITYEEYCSRRK